jgi:hypothetical protein
LFDGDHRRRRYRRVLENKMFGLILPAVSLRLLAGECHVHRVALLPDHSKRGDTMANRRLLSFDPWFHQRPEARNLRFQSDNPFGVFAAARRILT